MKKLILFISVLAAFAITSCSDDDNSGGRRKSIVTAKINGVPTVLDRVTVDEEIYPDYIDLRIKALNLNDDDNWLEFVVESDAEVGVYEPWFFSYYVDMEWYYQDPMVNMTITENSEDKLTGTFSGSFQYWDEDIDDLIEITEGEFTIYK